MSQIIQALSGIVGPWQVVALASIGALGYSLKQLLQWPRPAEVDRLQQTNVTLRTTITEQRAKLEALNAKREEMRFEKLKLEMAGPESQEGAS